MYIEWPGIPHPGILRPVSATILPKKKQYHRPARCVVRFLLTTLMIVFTGKTALFAQEAALEKRNTISIQLGPAITASGPILTQAGNTLLYMSAAINLQFLYSPGLTEAIRRTAPLYQIPAFELSSWQRGFQFDRKTSGGFSWGVSFQYLNILARLQIPATFIDPSQYNIALPGMYQVSYQETGRVRMANSYEVTGHIKYRWMRDSMIHPFARAMAGAGRGLLGTSKSTELREFHLGMGVGAEVVLFETSVLSLEAAYTFYDVHTDSSLYFDRRHVLANPRKGWISMGRIVFGIGHMF